MSEAQKPRKLEADLSVCSELSLALHIGLFVQEVNKPMPEPAAQSSRFRCCGAHASGLLAGVFRQHELIRCGEGR